MYGIISYSKTSVFVRQHKNDKLQFSLDSAQGTVFENLCFWCQETPFTWGRKDKTEWKISVFKNIRICVDGALDLADDLLTWEFCCYFQKFLTSLDSIS